MYPMRRKDRAISTTEARDLLEKGEYGFLATTGNDGLPYGVPLSYVLLQDRLYFHSAMNGRKLDNIRFCKQVSFTVVGDTEPVYTKNFTTYFESVMVFGAMHEVTDADEKFQALYALAAKYLPDYLDRAEADIRASFSHTAVLCLPIEEMTGKAKRPRGSGRFVSPA